MGRARPPRQAQPLQPAAGGSRQVGRAHQGADAFGDAGQHQPARPAQPDLPDDREAPRCVPRGARHRRRADSVRRRPARVRAMETARRDTGRADKNLLIEKLGRGFPCAARRRHHRPLPRSRAPLLSAGDRAHRRFPAAGEASEPASADRQRRDSFLRRSAPADRRVPAGGLYALAVRAGRNGAGRRGKRGCASTSATASAGSSA